MEEEKKHKNWLSLAFRVIVFLLLLVFFLLALLHIPAVQKRITSYVIGKVAKNIDAEIKIADSTFDLSKGVRLKDILVSKTSQDTLASIAQLSVSPRGTLLSLIRGDFHLNDVSIRGVDIYINRAKDETYNNWERALGAGQESNTTGSQSIPIDLAYFRLDDFSLKLQDHKAGTFVNASATSLELAADKIVLGDSLQVLLDRLILVKPVIDIRTLPSEPQTSTVDNNGKTDSVASQTFVNLDNLSIIDGDVRLHFGNEKPKHLRDLNVVIKKFAFTNPTAWEASLENASVKYQGDDFKYLSIPKIVREGGELTISRLDARVNNSSVKLKGTISNVQGVMDLSEAEVDIEMEPSKLFLQDFYNIAPILKQEIGNDPLSNKAIQLSGQYKWKQGNFNARNIALWIDDQHHFAGNVIFEPGATIHNSIINAEIGQLSSDMASLNTLTQKFKLPKEVIRLGQVSFEGSYDGYISDFVANGRLTTSLGNADMDIQFDLSGEGEEAIGYNGFLALDQFDLAGFMNNEEFGLVTAKVDITSGSGPDLPSSSADIDALISEITFKGYKYQEATYKGNLSSQVINGIFNIEDENADFEFEGIVDLSDEVPLFDFNIIVNKIDFCNLNIAKFPCQISFASDVSFRGSSLSTIEGRGTIGDIDLVQDSVALHIDNINLRSARIQRGMQLELTSDFLDFNIAGEFNLLKMFDHTVDQLLANTERHNATWKIKKEIDTMAVQDFSYSLYIKNASPLFEFLGQDIKEQGEGVITGMLDTEKNHAEIKAYIPYLKYKDFEADSIRVDMQSSDTELDLVLKLENFVRGGTEVDKASISANIHDEFLDWTIFGLTTKDDEISITGQSLVEKEGYFTKINEHTIKIDSNDWYFVPNDGFGIYPEEISFDSLTLTDGQVYVSFNDELGRALQVGLNDFQLGFINSLINYDKLEFSGKVNSTFKVVDVFTDRSLLGNLLVEDFLINGDDFGELSLKAQRGDQGVIDIDLSIEKDTQNLYAVGYADIENSFINVDINLEDYPMKFFEYIIDEGISETEGTTDITAKLHGNLDDLKMAAKGLIKNAGVRVDFLGAFYRMEDQIIKLDESFISMEGVELIDEMGNTGVISGGLRHNLLADITADLSVSSPRFIGLNTTEDDNPLYYGLAVGELDISFLGPFHAIDIRVDAEVGRLSQLYIPITSTQYGIEESFIKYDYDRSLLDSINESSLVELLQDQGADFEMNLSFTPDALVSVIYDATTSNVLNGHGEGDLRIRVKRDGAFTVNGDYTVVSGDYLFTSYGLIAKPFNIRPGGKVIWTGDPIDASLNLVAEYPGLRVPLTNLLTEFSSILSAEELTQRQDIDLTLLLGGTLYEPTIDFDLDFPNLIGPVKTYAQSKLRTLKTSENGINNQVVGLMVFRDFLPDNNPLAQTSIGTLGQTGANTVTQFITSQLSLMLSDYLSQRLDDDGFITGIDFEIAMANNTFNEENEVNSLFDEVQVNMRNRIKNGDVYFNIGGNYVRQSQLTTANNYVTGDFSLDWFLTDDRRLKLRFYSNIGFDEARSTGRQKYGLGINFRKEFGAITNFEAVLQDMVKGLNKESANR